MWWNGCSIRSGCGSTRRKTRNSASSGFFWSPAGALVSVGSFLGPDEKASFAKALLVALLAAKRGPTYNPIT